MTQSPKLLGRLGLALWLLALLAAATTYWLWLTGFDRPPLEVRDGLLAADIVRLLGQPAGTACTEPAPHADNPLVRLAAALAFWLGDSYRALGAFQLLWLWLLLAATAAIAWRLAGRVAAAWAPVWLLLTPVVWGAAQELGDLLAMTALAATSVALVAWDRRGPLLLLAALPLALAFWLDVTFSTGLLTAFVAGVASLGFVVPRLVTAYRAGGARALATPLAWWLAGWALLALWQALGRADLALGYVFSEAENPDYAGRWTPAAVLLGYPMDWVLIKVGPALAAAFGICLAVGLRRRWWLQVAPPAIWLLGPMLVLGLLAKRESQYVIATAPATALLIAAVLAKARPRLRRLASTALVLACLALNFAYLSLPLPTAWLGSLERHVPPSRYQPYDYVGAFHRFKPFFHSPLSGPNWHEQIARAVAVHCGAAGRDVFLDHAWGTDPTVDFALWHASRDTAFHQWGADAAPPAAGHCLLDGPRGPTPQPSVTPQKVIKLSEDFSLSILPGRPLRVPVPLPGLGPHRQSVPGTQSEPALPPPPQTTALPAG